MAHLTYGTADYDRVFGAQPEVPPFVSGLPEYYAITQAWADPSLAADLGLNDQNTMNSMLARDVQSGAQRMAWEMAVPGLANVPSILLAGMREINFSAAIEASLPTQQMQQIFDGAKRPPGGRGIVGVAIGAALAAAGVAIPIIGQIAGFLIAFASALVGLIRSNKHKKDLAEAKYREELYKLFPPLQVADSSTDTQIARKVDGLLTTDDWTPIFLPRFRGEWVGIERDRGYAFAPGSTQLSSDVFGQDVQAFESSGGVGCIPGTGIITSVLQVSIDPRGPEFTAFMKGGGVNQDPRIAQGAAGRVIDTGSFYPATAHHASLAWSWLTEDRGSQGNALLYRLDVQAMADAWKEYFLGGLDYIKRVAIPWWQKDRNANANLEGFFGSAVFYGVGSFAGVLAGGTTWHPKFAYHDPPHGVFRDAVAQPGLFRWSERSGAFLPLQEPSADFQAGMGTQWERSPNVRQTCLDLREQQEHDLQHTLVCMYVRRSAAAFKDAKLRELLDAKRRIILKLQQRMQLVMADIPPDEQLDGKLLRDLARAAGVPEHPTQGLPLPRAPRPRPSLTDKYHPPVSPWPNITRGGWARTTFMLGGLLGLAAGAVKNRKTIRGWVSR